MPQPVSGKEPVLLKLIGSGARYPWAFTGAGGSARIRIGGGMDKINGSIKHILGVRKGERFFLPEFGCLAAGTMILLPGSRHSRRRGTEVAIEDLVGDTSGKLVYSCDEFGKVTHNGIEGAGCTGKSEPVVRVSVTSQRTGKDSWVRCTEDHPFLLIGGVYREARRLQPGDRLMSIDRSDEHVTSVVADGTDDVYDLRVGGTHCFAISGGIFVHNSNLPSLVFEPLDEVTKDLVWMHTVGALREWEKRIIVESIGFDESEIERDQSVLHIFLEYRIIGSQITGNYVYPWYRTSRPPTGSVDTG